MDKTYDELLNKLDEEIIAAKDLESISITIQDAILNGNTVKKAYGDTLAILSNMLEIHYLNLKLIFKELKNIKN